MIPLPQMPFNCYILFSPKPQTCMYTLYTPTCVSSVISKIYIMELSSFMTKQKPKRKAKFIVKIPSFNLFDHDIVCWHSFVCVISRKSYVMTKNILKVFGFCDLYRFQIIIMNIFFAYKVCYILNYYYFNSKIIYYAKESE